MMKEFSKEAQKELKYYIYRLIDPRSGDTFYVGKGKDNRLFAHIQQKLLETDDSENLKLKQISEIYSSGLEPIHVIHRHGITDEKTAFEIEASLMDAYPGLTNVQGGHSSGARGCMNIKQIEEMYNAQEAEIYHNILFILINRSAVSGSSLKEATQGNWKLNPIRANKAEYILSIVDGVIRATWVSKNAWKPVGDRWLFEPIEAPIEISKLYVGKRIPSEYRKPGASNPIKYSY